MKLSLAIWRDECAIWSIIMRLYNFFMGFSRIRKLGPNGWRIFKKCTARSNKKWFFNIIKWNDTKSLKSHFFRSSSVTIPLAKKVMTGACHDSLGKDESVWLFWLADKFLWAGGWKDRRGWRGERGEGAGEAEWSGGEAGEAERAGRAGWAGRAAGDAEAAGLARIEVLPSLQCSHYLRSRGKRRTMTGWMDGSRSDEQTDLSVIHWDWLNYSPE